MTLDENQQLSALLETMDRLRSESGCSWDREQTPESLRPYILEEAYELVDAIDSGDETEILAELGDLLLQVVFQAQIFKENGAFGIGEVAAGIDRKLKRRHPHIFSEETDATTRHPSWEQIKQEELAERSKPTDFASRLPRNLPALKLADKVVQRRQRQGNSAKPAREQYPQAADMPVLLKERQLGASIFSLVEQAYAHGIDADLALRRYILELLEQEGN